MPETNSLKILILLFMRSIPDALKTAKHGRIPSRYCPFTAVYTGKSRNGISMPQKG